MDRRLLVFETSPSPRPHVVERLEREFGLRAELDAEWALKPIAIDHLQGRTCLVLEDPGGQPLDKMLGAPLDIEPFLEIAIGFASSLRKVHRVGVIHKDVRPANAFVDSDGTVRLTGFGFSSHLVRERQAPNPADIIPGTLAYMAPEQSGRVNRSVDSRSDLYSLGVSFYEMLVGQLPFSASQPLEWIYCHVARLPPPPSTRVQAVPPTIERLILKLLAKNVEDRYQTAAGVEYDLRGCLKLVQEGKSLEGFAVGQTDAPEKLVISERLYGRAEETKTLIDAFENVASHGSSDFVLVTGAPGIGKSALISELQSVVYAAGGLFAAGKFDQYKRHVPYATMAEAFQKLFRQILARPQAELDQWRVRLISAVGTNGQIMVDLFPEIKAIIGEQPALAKVSPQEAKNRFYLVFRNFISTFAQAERPLVIFLDDLQWLDGGTLELLELLAADEQIPYLLLLGAYRSDDVGADHPLSRSLATIANARGELQVLRLRPLKRTEVIELVSESLHADRTDVTPLAEVIFEKTQGNSFFAVQFLMNLEADNLLHFDRQTGSWRWDLDQINRQTTTRDVVALMKRKLRRYKGLTSEILRQLAVIGTGATDQFLALLVRTSEGDVAAAMRHPVNSGLVTRTNERYVFPHDDVQSAAYALVPAKDLVGMHLRIGRLLCDGTTDKQIEDGVFDALNHLNRGSSQVTDLAARSKLAGLNLLAADKARAAAAYGSALNYLTAGLALLSKKSWTTEYRLTFDLEFSLAECRFMLGETDAAEAGLIALAERAETLADLAAVVGRQVLLNTYLRRIEHALTLAVNCLARMGVQLPLHPSDEDIRSEYDRMMATIGDRCIDELADIPLMSNPRCLEIVEALAQIFPAAGEGNDNLHHLAALRLVNLTLEHGNAHESPHAYAILGGLMLGWKYGSFETAHAFGRLAIKLVDERGFNRLASRVYAVISGTVGPRSRPLAECYAMAVRATELGREEGGILYSGYAWGCALTALLDGGRGLPEVDRQADHNLAILSKLKVPLVTEFITSQLMLVRALRGMTLSLATMSDGTFDEEAFEGGLERSRHGWHALIRHRIRRLQLLVVAGDTRRALPMVDWTASEIAPLKVFEGAEFEYYSAIVRAAAIDGVNREEDARQWAALRTSHDKLTEWQRLCPETFSDRSSLVAAEIARLEHRAEDAGQLYELAIEFSRQNGFQQNEALGNELAWRYYSGRGLNIAACAYLRNARDCYARWGAAGKVAQLERDHPELVEHDSRISSSNNETGARLEHLDIAAAIQMYQALSHEIVLDKLIERLMVTVVEHAGAVRGLLLLSQDGRLRIVAEAATDHNSVKVSPRKPAHFSGELPQSVLNYVARTHEDVMIDDALDPNAHSGDPYILQARPRSVLCMPLVKQARLVGVLYLENDLASHVFTQDRLDVLRFIAAQAAISIENAELFLDVQRTQEDARRAEDELRQSFDMIPALAWSASPDGSFEFSNKQWHDYTGISEWEARGGTWMQAFHPDELERVTDKWKQLVKQRTSGDFEARMRRFDGQFRSFLVRITPMRDERGEVIKWHGTNTDIDDLKRAEEAQELLARASRVTAMGELTVSIAHEVNQPLMAIVTNAATCLRWLGNTPPNVAEATQAAERIIRDGHRAGDVIASIRAMAKKSMREMTVLRLDEIILEVLQLTRNELERYSITVETSFHEEAVEVFADRVQMQQVILNLVMNGIEAIRASKDGNRLLRIASTLGDAGLVEVAVTDTGVGIGPTDGERVFDAFFTTKPEGVGIGLSICRTIVEAHGGRFSVSANLPRGSEFRFSVPSLKEEHALAAAE